MTRLCHSRFSANNRTGPPVSGGRGDDKEGCFLNFVLNGLELYVKLMRTWGVFFNLLHD